ncbi:hypothetical protein ACJ73_09270, partial [Blastomyces percursus]
AQPIGAPQPRRSQPPSDFHPAVGGNPKKRSAASIECEEPRIPAGYLHGNASDENQPDSSSHLLDFTISDPDAPATPGLIPTPVHSRYVAAPESSVRRSLFPDKWEPDQTISAELQEVLRYKSASNCLVKHPTTMIRQCDVQELSYEIWLCEVAKIHDTLVDVEIRCLIEDTICTHVGKLSEKQWTGLIKCHRSLFDHHYDLLICTEHPIGKKEQNRISDIAVKHKTPARMFHQGIYVFLEFMKARRPDSQDYMISFIHHTYGLMTLLVEMVPRFKNLWLESLGDLTSYRMFLEEDPVEKNSWKKVSSHWYHKAVDENPEKGSLYHRLGNLLKPNMSRQLFFYSRSLMAINQCEISKTRVDFAFQMALDSIQKCAVIAPDLPSWFVGSHAMLFHSGSIQEFVVYVKEYIALFNTEVYEAKFREVAICMGVSNIAAMLQYGEKDGILTRVFIDSQKLSSEARLQHAIQYWTLPARSSGNTLKNDLPSNDATFFTPLQKLTYSTYLNFHTLSFVLNHTGNIIPFVHLSLAFIWSLALIPESMAYVEGEIPWISF